VLELGGSDPYLILEDADLEAAVEACVQSRMNNAGQSCIAAKRLIVVEASRAELEEKVEAALREVKMGDPREEGVRVGPLARKDLRDSLHRQVSESVGAGAKLRMGGRIPDGPGWFYPPTLLTDVRTGMPAYEEELFGPVVAILPVADEAEAIRVANDSAYGLGGGVFTRNLTRGEEIASVELEVGFAAVNDFVRSDPRLPFGGTKDSGYGRELGTFGIREFVNVKTVWVR
jgi:succinate-semialdehyde dehydrogenase/glutarate-semialdehyde dehydrogenase